MNTAMKMPMMNMPMQMPAMGMGMGMGMGMMGGGGATFTINGRTFNPGRVDTRVVLNSVEEWDFINPTMMDHPMHVHTNPFQVVGSDGAPLRAWKDVALVPAPLGRVTGGHEAVRGLTFPMV